MIAVALLVAATVQRPRVPLQPAETCAVVYAVQPGDSLWSIAASCSGDGGAWPALYAANRAVVGRDPGLILPGEKIRLIMKIRHIPTVATMAGHERFRTRGTAGHGASRPSGSPYRTGRGAPPSGTLGCAGLQALWIYAGGNPESARIAAQIAMAESDGRQYAHSPTDDYGYWQINASNGSLATYDPAGNALAAIDISGNGSDWHAWTTYTSGTYRDWC